MVEGAIVDESCEINTGELPEEGDPVYVPCS